ncbi:RagB/SusD family nutrient uptake outer membrane protein [Pontibacter litorisediminis]|uniref:RagB/SusD family nutrient uptake outer membrane protein n=1 Tax=Pontibacter litorisediminis TaxID=1846260 RepID=UPI0023EBA98E|nr:RagB/SusD family nutrient uptake outer membrane protein [Pontibacter litorisediminis]
MKIFNRKSNKKYIAKLALLSIPLSLTLTSCEKDFLEAKPELTVLEGANFDSPAVVLAQVNGLYASMKHGRFLGGRYQIYNDIRAEEFINRTSNNVTGYSIWNQTGGADEPYITDMWSRGYLTINRVNTFLAGLEENASKLDAELVENYRAEAKFIRAISYFSLVQMFAKPYTADNGASPGLPLRLQPEFSSDNNGLARSTVAEVYTQILKDLNEAEEGLPEEYSSAALATTRAHKNTAIALKTRVYLTMGRYADVITEGNKIVSESAPFTTLSGESYSLEEDIAAVFENDTNKEVIFAAPFADTDAPGTQNQLGYYYNVGNLEYYLNDKTEGIAGIYTNEQFEADDARKTSLISRYNLGSAASPRYVYYITKFSRVSPYIDWVPLIRYSEVLLNLAEAEAEVGSQERAIALLEAVHQRSDASWSYTGESKADLINAILTERRIELLGEGFRTNDLFRRGFGIPSVGAGAEISPTDSRYVLPIPTSETNTNPAL